MPSTVPGGLTVVMPLYNKGPHVDRAIASVLAQSAGFDALIVVDDGSSDDGPDRVAALDDRRITLLRRSPPGPGGYAARNLAIRSATTEWIAFLDADDAWNKDFLAGIYGLIGRFPEIGCAFTGYEMVDPDGGTRLSEPSGGAPATLSYDDFLKIWISDKDCPIWTGSTAFRRNVLLDAGLFPEDRCRRGGDKDLWLRAMATTSAGYDPRPLATYFRDSTNMVTNSVKTFSAHCIIATIGQMVADGVPQAERLKTLSNVETLNYSISAARSAGLNPDVYRTFYRKFTDPRYYLVKGIAACPAPFRPLLAKAVQRVLRIGE